MQWGHLLLPADDTVYLLFTFVHRSTLLDRNRHGAQPHAMKKKVTSPVFRWHFISHIERSTSARRRSKKGISVRSTRSVARRLFRWASHPSGRMESVDGVEIEMNPNVFHFFQMKELPHRLSADCRPPRSVGTALEYS